MHALLLTGDNQLLYEVRPRYAFGRFYVEEVGQDAIAFLCPGDVVRRALADGTAQFGAHGTGCGWHYPYHIRRESDGNVRGAITRLHIVATRRGDTLDLVADVEVARESIQHFIVKLLLDAQDLVGIGPDYLELVLS